MNGHLDATDQALLAKSVKLWDARMGPRVGDFVRMLDGRLLRFTHDWDDTIQTTMGDAQKFGESFYFSAGHMDFSGGLDRGIAKAKLVEEALELEGMVWFFHHGQAKAHNGVNAKVFCRVYTQTE